ncbi:Lipoprotein - like protein [Thioalkalivibrio nitratireducens DSM 14787]|uniref:Lipoprotein-like protein n=1 Tax=Thioalkalivibrio nitratireducens (strain DSM 14787 / UNIQEM 213 / ALEN2) TaxID=1255043 RepID=L0E033_THIND|nr:C40 family peptidase [Thioalkalivibrio nitratireducens]AGA34607.1 Lipoprotein - like protein [Thioalkalivibrio nitratireducens DSM 14787]
MAATGPMGTLLLSLGLLAACVGSPAPGPADGAGTPSTDTGLARSEVVLAALGHLDAPYRYGGLDASGLDCSALVQRVYRQAGVEHVPRTTSEQARSARRIPPARAQPGDVLFFATRGNRIDHVGVFIGEGRFIHAPSSRGQVRIEPLASSYWQPRLRKAGHFFE